MIYSTPLLLLWISAVVSLPSAKLDLDPEETSNVTYLEADSTLTDRVGLSLPLKINKDDLVSWVTHAMRIMASKINITLAATTPEKVSSTKLDKILRNSSVALNNLIERMNRGSNGTKFREILTKMSMSSGFKQNNPQKDLRSKHNCKKTDNLRLTTESQKLNNPIEKNIKTFDHSSSKIFRDPNVFPPFNTKHPITLPLEPNDNSNEKLKNYYSTSNISNRVGEDFFGGQDPLNTIQFVPLKTDNSFSINTSENISVGPMTRIVNQPPIGPNGSTLKPIVSVPFEAFITFTQDSSTPKVSVRTTKRRISNKNKKNKIQDSKHEASTSGSTAVKFTNNRTKNSKKKKTSGINKTTVVFDDATTKSPKQNSKKKKEIDSVLKQLPGPVQFVFRMLSLINRNSSSTSSTNVPSKTNKKSNSKLIQFLRGERNDTRTQKQLNGDDDDEDDDSDGNGDDDDDNDNGNGNGNDNDNGNNNDNDNDENDNRNDNDDNEGNDNDNDFDVVSYNDDDNNGNNNDNNNGNVDDNIDDNNIDDGIDDNNGNVIDNDNDIGIDTNNDENEIDNDNSNDDDEKENDIDNDNDNDNDNNDNDDSGVKNDRDDDDNGNDKDDENDNGDKDDENNDDDDNDNDNKDDKDNDVDNNEDNDDKDDDDDKDDKDDDNDKDNKDDDDGDGDKNDDEIDDKNDDSDNNNDNDDDKEDKDKKDETDDDDKDDDSDIDNDKGDDDEDSNDNDNSSDDHKDDDDVDSNDIDKDNDDDDDNGNGNGFGGGNDDDDDGERDSLDDDFDDNGGGSNDDYEYNDDPGSLGSLEDFLPLLIPILEDISDPDSDTDLGEFLIAAIPLLQGLSEPDPETGEAPDFIGVLQPIITNLVVGKDGQGSDFAAILGPLVQLLAPFIGPLIGPIAGPLSSQLSGEQGSNIGALLAALFEPLSQAGPEKGALSPIGLVTAEVISVLLKEISKPGTNLDIGKLVSQIVTGTLSGASSGLSASSKGHHKPQYGAPAPYGAPGAPAQLINFQPPPPPTFVQPSRRTTKRPTSTSRRPFTFFRPQATQYRPQATHPETIPEEQLNFEQLAAPAHYGGYGVPAYTVNPFGLIKDALKDIISSSVKLFTSVLSASTATSGASSQTSSSSSDQGSYGYGPPQQSYGPPKPQYGPPAYQKPYQKIDSYQNIK